MAETRVLVVDDAPASARRLLGIVHGDVRIVVVLLDGSDDAAAGTLDCDEVVVVDGLGPHAGPDALGAVVRSCLDGAIAVVVDDGPPGRDLAGWLAAELDAALVWGVDDVAATTDGIRTRRSVLGGSHRMVQSVDVVGPAVVIGKPVGAPPDGARGRPGVRRIEAHPPPPRIRPVAEADADEGTPGDSGIVPLATARVVVAVGRGIGGPAQVPLFRELATRLGAALGATRAVVDAGWLPFAHQVGQTGTAVAPDLYLAFGISGAIQHLAGMRDSGRVVAVNTDPDAAICRVADLVVVGDACGVARDLLARLPAPSDGARPAADADTTGTTEPETR